MVRIYILDMTYHKQLLSFVHAIKFDEEVARVTVPQAIICFHESNGFEDAIRNAVSIGGDSDTIACITGGLAEAFYGVPITSLIRHIHIYHQT